MKSPIRWCRGFLGAAAAMAMLPSPAFVVAGPPRDVVATLPGGFDIGGGPNPFARTLHGALWLPAEKAIVFSDGGNSRRLLWTFEHGYRVLHEHTNSALGTRHRCPRTFRPMRIE